MHPVYRNFNQAELDQQYNNRASVPNFEERMASWLQLAPDIKKNTRCLENVKYGNGDQEQLDLYQSGQKNSPVIVFFHGGDFSKLTKDHAAFAATGFVAAGISYIAADFPMRPTHTITQIRESARKLIQWLWNHAVEYNIDPDQIFIAGASSGSNICCQLLMTDWQSQHIPQSVIKGTVLLGPLADWAPVKLSYRQRYLNLTDEEVEFMSMSCFKGKLVSCPVIVINGGSELTEYQRQGQWLTDDLANRGYSIKRFLLPGHDHFNIIDTWAMSGSEPFLATVNMINNNQ